MTPAGVTMPKASTSGRAPWVVHDGPASSATETTTQFRPVEGNHQRGLLRTDKSNFPKSNYPNDYRTLQQCDFRPDALDRLRDSGVVRGKPLRDNGQLMPHDITPTYATQSGATLGAINRAAVSESRSLSRAGGPATKSPGFNIITGGTKLQNNAFEAFDGVKDYRRVR